MRTSNVILVLGWKEKSQKFKHMCSVIVLFSDQKKWWTSSLFIIMIFQFLSCMALKHSKIQHPLLPTPT